MNSVGKWKIATYILALTTVGALWHGRGTTVEAAKPGPASARDASYQRRLSSLSRLRIPAGVVGIDEGQLLRDLKSASSLQEITLICQRLGIFGTDRAIDSLEALSRKRSDAAGVAILAIGGIGSDQATERLIRMAESGRRTGTYWAVRGLAKTSNRRAHAQIFDWARQSTRRELQQSAIEVLGEVGGDEALEILVDLSKGGDNQRLHRVLAAAGQMGTDDSTALIQKIADRGNRSLRMAALRNMPRMLSEDAQEWLMDVLAGSDSDCAGLAAEALGRAGVRDALPLLLDAAASGNRGLRAGAVRALSSLGGDEVRVALQELFANARTSEAYELGRALLDMGGEDGRRSFLETLRKGHPARTELIGLLQDFSGEEVHALRVEIMKTGSFRERQLVMNQLLGSEDPEVASMMMDLAKTGSQNDRYTSLNYLAQSSSKEARQAILDIAQGRGQASVEALRLLGDHRAAEPEVQSILMDALYSGVPGKAQSASWALANSGSEAARAALLGALESDNPMLANAALGAVQQLGQGPEVMEALQHLALASKNPQVKSSALYQLANSGDSESTELVVQAIASGDSMAGGLVSVLLQRGGPDASRVMDVAASSESPQTRAALASALGGQGGTVAEDMLDALTRDSDASVKNAAVYALANVGGKKSSDRLLELARAGDDEVRRTAISALGNSGDPRAGTIIAEAIGSDDRALAQSAIYSAHSGGPEVDEALLALADNSEAEMYLRQQAASTLINRGAVDSDRLDELQALSGQSGMSEDYPLDY